MTLLEVLNPVAQRRGLLSVFQASPRPTTLDNLSQFALERAGEMLQERQS